MDIKELDLAAQRYREAEEAFEEARSQLQTVAVRALQNGVRQVDVVHKTGWTREYLRRLRQRAESPPSPANPDGP